MTCSSKPIQIQKKKIIPNAYGKVLEIGFGSGVNLKLYNDENVEKIYGIDPSQELHVLAYENAKSVNISIDLQIGSAEELPFEDNRFDTVALLDLIKVIENEKNTFRNPLFQQVPASASGSRNFATGCK